LNAFHNEWLVKDDELVDLVIGELVIGSTTDIFNADNAKAVCDETKVRASSRHWKMASTQGGVRSTSGLSGSRSLTKKGRWLSGGIGGICRPVPLNHLPH